MMNQNLKNLLSCELTTVGEYLDRLYHALYEVSELGKGTDFKHKLFENVELLSNQFNRSFLSEDSFGNTFEIEDTRQVRTQLDRLFSALPYLINSVGPSTDWTEKVTEFINSSYQLAFIMHKELKDKTEIDVQLPRLNILQMEEIPSITKETRPSFTKSSFTLIHSEAPELPEEEVFIYKLFKLPLEAVKEFGFTKNGMLSSLIQQRRKKYEELLHEGHQAVFENAHQNALGFFDRALNYIETAEVLTLIGWCYSLMGELEPAKKYCLRAIQVDADYGPPYNDLGSYLLGEGKVEESLKWFDLAKKALHYQNREYPYINSGRAWMHKKNISRALDEFSKALSLAPYNEELHETVQKLKKSMLGSIPSNKTEVKQATFTERPKLPPFTLRAVENDPPEHFS